MRKRLGIDRRFVAAAHDLTMAAVSYVLALYLRLGDGVGELPESVLFGGLVAFMASCAVA